jgi:ketosteroid isomerase-like protein
VDAALALSHCAKTGSSLVGIKDFKGYIAGWLDAFDDLRFEFHEFVDFRDQVVVVTDFLGAAARATGADVRGAYVFVWTAREGRVVELREYATKEEVLEAAGLSEQDAHADF